MGKTKHGGKSTMSKAVALRKSLASLALRKKELASLALRKKERSEERYRTATMFKSEIERYRSATSEMTPSATSEMRRQALLQEHMMSEIRRQAALGIRKQDE
eukprot:1636926-Rhodomonas_salina.2